MEVCRQGDCGESDRTPELSVQMSQLKDVREGCGKEC